MGRKLMIEVDENFLELLRGWQEAGKAHSAELLRDDYDLERANAIFHEEQVARLRFAIAAERRIREAIGRDEV